MAAPFAHIAETYSRKVQEINRELGVELHHAGLVTGALVTITINDRREIWMLAGVEDSIRLPPHTLVAHGWRQLKSGAFGRRREIIGLLRDISLLSVPAALLTPGMKF